MAHGAQKMNGRRAATFLLASSSALFAFCVVFRALIYDRIYISPGEPTGISDVIELALGCLLLALLGISLVASLVLTVRGPRENRVAAAWLGVGTVAMAVILGPVHEWAARLALH